MFVKADNRQTVSVPAGCGGPMQGHVPFCIPVLLRDRKRDALDHLLQKHGSVHNVNIVWKKEPVFTCNVDEEGPASRSCLSTH